MSKINSSYHVPKDTARLIKKIHSLQEYLYELFMNELKSGDIHPIIFDLFDEEELQQKLNLYSQTLAGSHTYKHRK